MSSPLVATKLFVPRPRGLVLDRARLAARLDGTARARLTLVSAPPGFGKTTAVADWIARRPADDHAVAWVSLEDGDAHAATFWSCVVAALQSALPGVGGAVQPLLDAGRPPTDQLIATLVNEVAAQPVEVDLVLDDYHLADSPDVADGMTHLLEHLPPNLHVVLISRADPDLPLARLRVRGELVEVRARDLRFTPDEVASYFESVGGLAIEAPDVATLAERTEGWAAALRLATLSMQDRPDLRTFVSEFAGDDRHVVDYLVDEVLSRQPDEVRDFLLRTCLLERLTGDLCDAVTGRADGRAMLDRMDRANLFLVPLDDRRHWYRYHHLFADVLRAHLDAERPGEPAVLHRRASQWFAAAGEPVPAVRHALACGDVERAADIAEAALPVIRRERREVVIRGWVDQFPDGVVRHRPVLAIGLVGGLMQGNEFDSAEPRLREVEAWLPAIHARLAEGGPGGRGSPRDPAATTGEGDGASPDPAAMAYLSHAELERVPATVHMYRAALALVRGDLPVTLARAELCAGAAQPDDHLAQGAAAALSGLARWAMGDLDAAHAGYRASMEHLRRAGHLADVLGCTIAVADIRIAQGRLADAQRHYEEGLLLSGDATATPLRGAADMHVGLAEVALERGELSVARDHLARARTLGESLGLPQLPYRLRACSAVLAEADGDPGGALDLLAAAQGVFLSDFSPDVRPLAARAARVHATHGDLAAALRWAAGHAEASNGQLSYASEFEDVTLAEVLLAQHRRAHDQAALGRARELLGRLLGPAEAGGRVGTVLDVLVLTSLAAEAAGDHAAALASVQRATDLAAATGHVRVFTRHGAALLPLPDTGGRRPAELPEPLSVRELEVLRLLASDLDGPGIARHLVVSLNTVRTHTRHIYAKLGVTNRRSALRRAQELGLPLTG